jgi:hypothetical protein
VGHFFGQTAWWTSVGLTPMGTPGDSPLSDRIWASYFLDPIGGPSFVDPH